MPNYTRAYIPGGTFFFTVALLERKRRLLTDHIESLREAFRNVQAKRPFTINAIVVLPDHLHCIWTLPTDDADYSTRWRLIKTRFARNVPTGERLSARRCETGERGIWQRRFWEHAIRDQRDFAAHVDYIHYNTGQARACANRSGLVVFKHPPLYRTWRPGRGLGHRSGRAGSWSRVKLVPIGGLISCAVKSRFANPPYMMRVAGSVVLR